MRRAARIDATQGEIVHGLRAAGAFVQSLATIGKGCPDLLVAYRGRWYPIETKPSKGGTRDTALREAQVAWWLASKIDPAVARTIDDALRIIGAIE